MTLRRLVKFWESRSKSREASRAEEVPIQLVGGKVEEKAEKEANQVICASAPQQVVRGLDINRIIASKTLRRLTLIKLFLR